MKRCFYLLTLTYLLAFYTVDAQNLLPVKGRVIDGESGKPLPYATVYFNNSSYGATTDEAGEFQFYALPGKYDLIVNFLSYQPIIFPFELSAVDNRTYLFKMTPLEYDLPEISVESSRDEIWYKNFQTFKNQFLGTSEFASSCEILNPEVFIIDFNPKTRVMKVKARSLIKIENKALGYRILYLLDKFEYNIGKGYVYFQGYPGFEMMEGSKSRQKKWAKARQKAYHGSITHFMASVIAGTTESEGYQVTEIVEQTNINKPTTEEVKQARDEIRLSSRRGIRIDSDSEQMRVIKRSNQPDKIRVSNNAPYPTDSLITQKGKQLQAYFPNLLKVRYTKEASEPAYTGSTQKVSFQESILSLTGGPAEVMKNGILTDPLSILLEGYMGWEKVGDMLPVDYDPQQP